MALTVECEENLQHPCREVSQTTGIWDLAQDGYFGSPHTEVLIKSWGLGDKENVEGRAVRNLGAHCLRQEGRKSYENYKRLARRPRRDRLLKGQEDFAVKRMLVALHA